MAQYFFSSLMSHDILGIASQFWAVPSTNRGADKIGLTLSCAANVFVSIR